MWFKKFLPKADSKTQKMKEPVKIKYVACKKCHRTGVTLIKGTDSYYCKDCYNKLPNNKKRR